MLDASVIPALLHQRKTVSGLTFQHLALFVFLDCTAYRHVMQPEEISNLFHCEGAREIGTGHGFIARVVGAVHRECEA